MSNIEKYLKDILSARYGKDVRQSIHDAIHQCYEDGKAGSMDLIARESIESLQDDVSKLNADAITLDSKVKTIDSRVDSLDIKKTTDSTLHNSKHGGARLTKMVGNTVQNGTPTPINPQPMYHTSDVVEMIQGSFEGGTGAYNSKYTRYVSNKNPIPCKSGDVIGFELDKADKIYMYYYSDNAFMSATSSSTKNAHSFTVPSGVTKFNFSVGNDEGEIQTPQTVGKITLTINGKYVNCIREHEKNLFDNDWLLLFPNWTISNGYYFGMSGADRTNILAELTNSVLPIILGKQIAVSFEGYTVSANNSLAFFIEYADGTFDRMTIVSTTSTKYTLVSNANKTIKTIGFTSFNSQNVCIKDFQIEIGNEVTPYEPYQETVAYFLTEKPMMADSVLFREDGLFKVEHGKIEYVFNNTSNWVTSSAIVGRYGVGTQEKPNGECLCNMAVNVSNGTDVGTCFNNDLGNFYINTSFKTLDEWKAYLDVKEVVVCMDRATPYIEVLDTESQLALHSLKTFDNVTYIESGNRTKPSEIEVEYGTSQVGAYTLQSLNNTEANAIRLNELAVAMVSLGSEV